MALTGGRIRTGVSVSEFDPGNYVFNDETFVPGVDHLRLTFPFEPKDQNWPVGRKNPVVPSCVSCAITGAVEYLAQPGWDTELSPLFHYYCTRGRPESLARINFLDGLAQLKLTGICSAASHRVENNPEGARQAPSAAALQEASGFAQLLKNKLVKYHSIDPVGVNSLLAWLSGGFPVLATIHLTAGYENITPENPVHGPAARTGDYHAVLIAGFHHSRQQFIVRDSRGSAFGQGGYWYLPYSLLKPPRLVWEAWGLRNANPGHNN